MSLAPAFTFEFLDPMPDEHRRRLAEELAPDECLIWAAMGKPKIYRPGVLFTAGGLFGLMLLGLALIGFSSVFGWVPGSPRDKDPPLIALLFLSVLAGLIWLGMIAFWSGKRGDTVRSANTLYALSDRRIILWLPSPAKAGAVEVHSLGRGAVAKVHRLEYDDGSGDVVLTTRIERQRLDPDALPMPERYEIRDIAKVRHVEDLVRTMLLGPSLPFSSTTHVGEDRTR
jgi:hypothetical protein